MWDMAQRPHIPTPPREKFISSYRGSEPVWTDRTAKRCTATIPSFKLHRPRSQCSLSADLCRSKPGVLKFLHCLTPFVPIPITPVLASHRRNLPPPAARPRPHSGEAARNFPSRLLPPSRAPPAGGGGGHRAGHRHRFRPSWRGGLGALPGVAATRW